MTTCPSCGGALAKMPTRKTKCPHCGQFMFVKYTPTDPVRRLVTATRAEEVEREWAALREQRARDDVAMSVGLPAGLGRDELQRALERIALSGLDRHQSKMAAHYLATQSDTPASRQRWGRMVFLYQLAQIGEQGFPRAVIWTGRDACPSCVACHGRLSDLQVALGNPIPNPECANWPRLGTNCAWWAPDLSENDYGLARSRL